MANIEYDVVVIGAGAIGENVADRAVQGGLSVVIVEEDLVGGECSYWACMPSKALLRSGALLKAARSVGGVREAVTGDLDVAAVLRRRDAFTSHWNDDGQVAWLKSASIHLIRGHALITGEREVTVTTNDGTTTVVLARQAVAVCTGSVSLLPEVPGLAECDPWTSREATSAQEIPARMAIIGGGVVAAEMATAFSTFGCQIDLIARGTLLSKNEPFAGELVAEALQESGVNLHLGCSPVTVNKGSVGSNDITVELDNGSSISVEKVLVATGRLPRTMDLGLESVGLTPGDWMHVDDTMLVQGANGEPIEGRWLYAVGDVNHRALLTHQGKYQARAAGDAIAARAQGAQISDTPWSAYTASADHEAVPQVTFTDPEVASVGLTAAQARSLGYRIRVVDYSLAKVAGASIASDGYKGQARMVVDEDRLVLLGVTFVGAEVGELVHSATIAIVGQVPLDRLWHAVPSYPTISEVWLRLLETYGRPTQ